MSSIKEDIARILCVFSGNDGEWASIRQKHTQQSSLILSLIKQRLGEVENPYTKYLNSHLAYMSGRCRAYGEARKDFMEVIK